MAEKRPICNYSGEFKELLTSDSLPAAPLPGIITIPATSSKNIEVIASATLRSIKWLITVSDTVGLKYNVIEVSAIHDGTTASFTEYGDNGDFLNYAVNVALSGADLVLSITNNSSAILAVNYVRLNVTPQIPTVITNPPTGSTNALWHFNGNGVEVTGKQPTATVGNGATWSSTSPKFGSGSVLLGTTFDSDAGCSCGSAANYLNFHNFQADFTVEMWVKNLSAGSTRLQTMFSTGRSALAGLYFQVVPSTGRLYLYYRSADYVAITTIIDVTVGAFSLDAWNYWAVKRSGSTISIWLNGIQKASAVMGSPIGTIYQCGLIQFGWIEDYATTLVGYIDEVRITKGFACVTSVIPTAEFSAY